MKWTFCFILSACYDMYSNKIKKTSLTHLTKEFADYLKVMRHVWNGLGLACEIIANCTLKFRAGRSSEYLPEQVLLLLLSNTLYLGKALFLHEQFECYFSITTVLQHLLLGISFSFWSEAKCFFNGISKENPSTPMAPHWKRLFSLMNCYHMFIQIMFCFKACNTISHR